METCESTPKGVQTQRRRRSTTKNRTLRGQKGMVDAGDLNPRPSGCKPDALPTELSALVFRAVSLSLLSLHLHRPPLTRSQSSHPGQARRPRSCTAHPPATRAWRCTVVRQRVKPRSPSRIHWHEQP